MKNGFLLDSVLRAASGTLLITVLSLPAARLVTGSPPVIQPSASFQPQSVALGQNMSFTVSASGDFPQTVLNRIRAIRGGKLHDPRFGTRMRGEGIFADQIARIFHVACRRVGLPEDGPELSTANFHRPEKSQLVLEL